MSKQQKIKQAIQYLRERKIYILEFPFKPTNAAKTDIAQTFAKYRRDVLKQPFPSVIRKREKKPRSECGAKPAVRGNST